MTNGNPYGVETMDAFTTAYIEAALWSSTDGDDTPLDRNHDANDIHPETLTKMIEECRQFQQKYEEFIQDENVVAGRHSCDEQAGHDFWLTRCGHGAGFWDGDWKEPAAEMLTDASKLFGEVELYVGDDDKIHALWRFDINDHSFKVR